MTTRCFFPLLGNVSPCKSKASGRGLSYHAIVVSGVGTFQGVSVGWPNEWTSAFVLCLCESIRRLAEILLMSPRWNSSVQLYHNWKRRRLSCGCVRASADWFSLPHWATNSDHLCGGAWSTSGTHARRNTYTWGGEWMTGLTTTQGSYWWHHYWAYGYSTLYMFRGPFNLHHGSFKGMTPVAFFLNYSIWSAPVVNRILILADHDGT